MRRITRSFLLTIPGWALSLALLAAPAPGQEIQYGPEATLGDGTVRTYLIIDQSGKPTELGAAISEVAMATVPDLSQKPPMESFFVNRIAGGIAVDLYGVSIPLYMTAICGVLAAALIATQRSPAAALAAAE